MPVTDTMEKTYTLSVDSNDDDFFDPLANEPVVIDDGVKEEDLFIEDGSLMCEPKIDENGKFYWHALTTKEFLASLAEAEKGPFYTMEEVRQNLEQKLGFKV